jgi:hypothetical protein
LVLARIQLRFSLSALFLVTHLRTVAHATWGMGKQRGGGARICCGQRATSCCKGVDGWRDRWEAVETEPVSSRC